MTKRPRSEFFPCRPFDGDGHVCQGERVIDPAGQTRAIYIVFDGRRIAARGRLATGERGWVSLVPGYEVVDESPDVLAVFFRGERVH
jgi:hypothetical protein